MYSSKTTTYKTETTFCCGRGCPTCKKRRGRTYQ